jgi:hypothetical protein
METLEFIKRVEDGKIVIELPADMEGKNLKVRIEEDITTEPKPEDWAKLPAKERLKILQRFKGTAKYPDADTNKYDVYDQ